MKIALIDDDEMILQSLVEVLSCMGYEPIPFSCPKLAISVISKSDIFLVLVDFHMKSMVGTEVIEALKQQRPLIECMVMTADGYRQAIIDSMRAGAADFIRKPFDLNELEHMLEHAKHRLKAIRKLSDGEKLEIHRALAVCRTEKEAAEKLGINYTTLYRKKKVA